MSLHGGNLTKPETLKLAYLPVAPFFSIIGSDGNGLILDGVIYKVITYLEVALGVKIDPFWTSEMDTGALSSNGSWTGLAGWAQRAEVDLLFPWNLDEYRTTSLLASLPLIYSPVKIIASRSKCDAGNFFGFLFTFDKEIWYTIFGMLTVTVLLSALSDNLTKSTALSDNLTKSRGLLESINRIFWMYLSALFCEGTPKLPASGRSKFLLALWLLAIFILMNAFCGAFKTLLMLKREEDYVNSMEDLASKPHLLPIVPRESAAEDVIKFSEIETYKKVWATALRNGEDSIRNIADFFGPELHQEVKDGKAVLIFEPNIGKAILSLFCQSLTGPRQLYFADEELFPIYFNFGVRPGFPKELLNKMDKSIRRLTEGFIIRKLLDDALRGYQKCEDVATDEDKPLAFSHLLAVFYLLAIFYGLAGIICFAEVLQFRFR